jgi:hypothetical protein
MNKIYNYILCFLCGILFYYIVNSIDKLELGGDVVDPIIGGWCQCAYGNKPVWDQPSVNTIIAGGFQGIGSIGPFGKEINISNNLSLDDTCYGKNILDKYTHKWLSVGGDKVGCKGETNKKGEYITFCPQHVNTCLDNALELIQKYNFNGIAFDMEGCLSLTHDVINDINIWITTNKTTLGPDFNYVYVGEKWSSEYDFSNFTYICPMLYSSDNSYNNVTGAKSIIDEYINSWTANGWQKDQIILTYQAISAMGGRPLSGDRSETDINNGKIVLQYLTNLLINDKYAGLLGWPPGYVNDFLKQKKDADGCMTIINQIFAKPCSTDSKPRIYIEPNNKSNEICSLVSLEDCDKYYTIDEHKNYHQCINNIANGHFCSYSQNICSKPNI